MRVEDDETVSIVLSKSSLEVDEGDATGGTYTVKLATEPSETVTVTVSGQADTDLTLSGLSGTNTLSFTVDNWDTGQPVTVTAGEDPDGSDNAVMLTHTASGGEYAGVSAELPVTVNDNGPDMPPIDVGSQQLPVLSLKVSRQVIEEMGGSRTSGAEVTATLNRASTAETTVTVSTTPASVNWLALSSNTTLTIGAGETESTGTVTVTALRHRPFLGDREVLVRGTAQNSSGIDGPEPVGLTVQDPLPALGSPQEDPYFDSILLIWDAPGDPILYSLQRDEGGCHTWSPSLQGPKDVATTTLPGFDDSSVEPATRYCYRVRAQYANSKWGPWV